LDLSILNLLNQSTNSGGAISSLSTSHDTSCSPSYRRRNLRSRLNLPIFNLHNLSLPIQGYLILSANPSPTHSSRKNPPSAARLIDNPNVPGYEIAHVSGVAPWGAIRAVTPCGDGAAWATPSAARNRVADFIIISE
jgi:hypothetical protein